jgi:hypothetical protein
MGVYEKVDEAIETFEQHHDYYIFRSTTIEVLEPTERRPPSDYSTPATRTKVDSELGSRSFLAAWYSSDS